MKAILISIRPEWVAKILNGEKTLEIRKNCPAIYSPYDPIDVYIYCTKEDSLSRLIDYDYPKNRYVCEQNFKCEDFPKLDSGYEGKGKVVAKFTLNKVEELRPFFHWCEELEKATCLTCDEVLDYLDSKDKSVGNPKRQGKVYAWHIDNLEIFDKPKSLSVFGTLTNKCNGFRGGKKPLTKAPQSWCYVEI